MFFTQRMKEVIAFYLKFENKKIIKTTKPQKLITKQEENIETEATMLLEGDSTELLDIAQDFATALLDAENKDILDF